MSEKLRETGGKPHLKVETMRMSLIQCEGSRLLREHFSVADTYSLGLVRTER